MVWRLSARRIVLRRLLARRDAKLGEGLHYTAQHALLIHRAGIDVEIAVRSCVRQTLTLKPQIVLVCRSSTTGGKRWR